MKRRSLPIWLLRDVPAFLGVMISFWPLMILVIRNGFAAMRGKTISKSVFDQLPIFLAHAESRLDFALWREAYRRIGWNPRAISFELFSAPESWADTARRFENYRRASMSLEVCARGYVEHLREQHSLTKAELVAHGSTDARLHRAAHHELVGVAMFQRSQFALTLCSAQRARPSKGERGPAHARGPPWRSRLLKIKPSTSHAPRAISHPHAPSLAEHKRTADPASLQSRPLHPSRASDFSDQKTSQLNRTPMARGGARNVPNVLTFAPLTVWL
jgi:hypothetical protein